MGVKKQGFRRVLLLLALTLAWALPGSVSALEAEIVSVTGRVEVRQNQDPWRDAAPGMTVGAGTTVSTGFNSQAVLDVGPARLEVSSLSRLTLQELIEREGLVSSDLHLQVGRVRADVRRAEGIQSEFNLRSPVATAAVRGTSFEFDGVNVRVFSGTVALANMNNQRVTVGEGESSSTTGEDVPARGDASREAEATVAVRSPTVEADGEEVTRTQPATEGSLRILLEFGGEPR